MIYFKDDKLETKFWNRVERIAGASGCWIWMGTLIKCNNGYYSSTYLYKQRIGGHRMSWLITHGSIPYGKQVLHRCDVPMCVNPDHLFLGTQADNMADKVAKGRQARGMASGQAKLTDKEVIAIRRSTLTYKELATIYSVSRTTIERICSRQVWKHLE